MSVILLPLYVVKNNENFEKSEPSVTTYYVHFHCHQSVTAYIITFIYGASFVGFRKICKAKDIRLLLYFILCSDKISDSILLNRTQASLNCSTGFMNINLGFQQQFYGIVYADYDRNKQTLVLFYICPFYASIREAA